MIAEIAVKHNNINNTPPERSMTDWVNLRPKPETKTDPIIIPAQAQAMVTGTVDLMPLSKAPNKSTTDILVFFLIKLKIITDTILQKPAVIAVFP
jgi:hypothetical protein